MLAVWIISKSALRLFWERHGDARDALQEWHREVARATWDMPNDVQGFSSSVRTIPNNRAVFNIRGNNYRLVVEINYRKHIIYVRFVGTHAEYDRIDAREV